MSTTEPSWDHYAALLAVLDAGSLSGASRALGLTQPTVRRQVEALEAALGVALFTRAANGLTPTEAARAARPYAESIAAAARALGRAVSGGADADRGTVRLTCSEVVAAEVVPPVLRALRDAHPGLQVELAATNRSEDLLRRDADVAVRMVEPTQSGLYRARAARIALGLFAHPDYLAAHPPPRALADLGDGHWLIGDDRGGATVAALAALGLPLRARDFALRSDSDLVKLAALRAGLGVGVCQVPLAAGLTRVLPKVALHLDAWVVTHEDLRANRRVRVVFDALVAHLGRYAAGEGAR